MAKTSKQSTVTKKTLIRLERERAQRRYLLIGIIAIGVLVVGIILFGLLDQFVLSPGRAVAQVGAEKITVKDFQWRVRYSRMQLIQQYFSNYQTYQFYAGDETLSQYFQSILAQVQTQLSDDETQISLLGLDVLDTLIEERVIEQEAKKLGITVSDAELEADLQSAFGYFANGTPTAEPIPSEVPTSTYSPTQLALVTPVPTLSDEEATQIAVELEPTPTSQVSGMSSQDIAAPTATFTPMPTATDISFDGYQTLKNEYITAMESVNLTEEHLRYQLYIRNIKDQLRDELTKDVKPEAEMVWVRQIMVADLETANTVVERLEAGEDFTALAAELSTDTSTNFNGGDIGWFGLGQQDAEFEKVAFNLSIGQISDPIETATGIYIIQVLGHELHPLTYSQFEQARDDKFNQWLETAVAAETVKKFDIWEKVIPTDPKLEDFLTQ